MLCGSARADKCAAVQRCGLWRSKTCLNSGVSIETSGNQFSPESPISSPHCPAPWYCRELPASIFPRASAVVLVEASRRGALVTLFRPAVASDRMTTQCGLTMVQPGRLTSEAKPTTRHPLGGTCGSLSGVLHPPTSAGRVTAAADVVFRRPQSAEMSLTSEPTRVVLTVSGAALACCGLERAVLMRLRPLGCRTVSESAVGRGYMLDFSRGWYTL